MKGKFKKILCLTMAVLMLLFSPVATAMSNINEVHATGLEAYYGAQLFEMILSTYGVSQLGDSASKEKTYREFGEYLNSIEKPDVWSIFQGFSQANPKVRITKEILTPVYSFLIKKFGSLTSGKQNIINSSTVYRSGNFSAVQAKILEYAKQNWTKNHGYYFMATYDDSSTVRFLFNPTYLNDYLKSPSDLIQLVPVWGSNGIAVYAFFKDTGRIDKSYNSSSTEHDMVLASCNVSKDTYSIGDINNKYSWKAPTVAYETNMPIVRTSLSLYQMLTSNLTLEELQSDSLNKSPISIRDSASWGSYNQKTIDAITDKEIDSSTVLATVASAGSAVKENTTTSDTGEDSYSDTIASAVATAVAKALADAGVISKDNTGTDTGDKEETETPAGLMAILAEILSAIKAIPQFFTDNILDAVYGIRDAVKSLGGYIADARDKVVAGIESIPAYIESTSDKIADVIVGAQTALAGIFSNVLDEVKAIPKSIADIFTDVIEGAKTGWMTLWDWLKKILDAILSLPASIAELIEAILTKVFAPNLTKAQDQILVIQNKFGWVGVLNDCIKSNLTSLNPNSSPPVIYIDFTQAESSKYVKVGKQLAIDFSWYAKYKPTGDAIIGSFMWIVYLWYLWKRLPDIISGGGMLTMGSMKFEDNMAKKNAKETKGKE